jgi:beta-phosphoglucomutase-like phosphatase (HAD superfamily)
MLDRSAARCLVVEDTVVGARAALRAGAPVVIRGRESEWVDDAMRSDLEGFFDDYPELHRRLGWGTLAEEAA